jgi:3-(3-hydroxy-phenyl)propionate hydroxylase
MATVPDIPVWRTFGAAPKPVAALERHETLIAGGSLVGLTIALDLAMKGHKVVVLNRLDFVPAGSKAICYAKRTLEILDRLGVADTMVAKGVVWEKGKVFWGDSEEPIYQYDLLPVKNQKMPAFINLQQYHAETILAEALSAMPNAEIRWGHALTGVEQKGDIVRVEVQTADGPYSIETGWLLACDGNRSTVRDLLGLEFEGRVFEDNFLIADIKMHGDRPSERWFWFDPPFNRGQSALFHKQPDNVWRLDFQLGWDIDREASIRDENVEPYIRAMLGEGVPFEKEWYSLYTFQCRRMARFVHGRVIFAGDSAHLVSPFGARGFNGGVADADNLVWKLDLILRGEAGPSLLESYNDEATTIADENILNSTRSTDFMTPKSVASRALRDAVLELARDHAFARPFVNSGRLSTAVSYPASALNTPDEDEGWAGIAPGSPAIDGPLGEGWLLNRLGNEFVLLTCDAEVEAVPGLVILDLAGAEVLLDRYDLEPGSACLVRPDQYVAARWRSPTAAKISAALSRAKGGVA